MLYLTKESSLGKHRNDMLVVCMNSYKHGAKGMGFGVIQNIDV